MIHGRKSLTPKFSIWLQPSWPRSESYGSLLLTGLLTYPSRCEKKSHLTGLIYVHCINDHQVEGASRRNLRVFRKLCGTDSLKNVVIVTTMWDEVTPEEGSRCEQELMSNNSLFKPLLDDGAIMVRHDRTAESASKVIAHILGKSVTTPLTVRGLVVERKILEQIAPGTELDNGIDELTRESKEEADSLKAKVKLTVKREFAEERQKTDHILAKLRTEPDEPKRGTSTGPSTGCVS